MPLKKWNKSSWLLITWIHYLRLLYVHCRKDVWQLHLQNFTRFQLLLPKNLFRKHNINPSLYLYYIYTTEGTCNFADAIESSVGSVLTYLWMILWTQCCMVWTAEKLLLSGVLILLSILPEIQSPLKRRRMRIGLLYTAEISSNIISINKAFSILCTHFVVKLFVQILTNIRINSPFFIMFKMFFFTFLDKFSMVIIFH